MHMRVVMAAMVASLAMAGPARAADWWLVSNASERDAVFADVETLARHGDVAQMKVMRIDRAGRSAETVEKIGCADGQDALGRFACSSEEERTRYGLILAAMNPADVARTLFRVNPPGG